MSAIAEIDFDIIIMNIRKGVYRNIGSGSGRLVFDIGDGYVAKVAKNKKGIAQNEAEYQIAAIDTSNLFAKIRGASERHDIIIMEKAECIRNFNEIKNYFNVRNSQELFRKEEIQYIFKDYNLMPQDLSRVDSWGLVNGRPVIIDYGFTWYVKRKYYFPF